MSIDSILIILGLKGLGYNETIWLIFGLLGQLIFFSRWVVQWIASERNSRSVIPTPFWWFSLYIYVPILFLQKELKFLIYLDHLNTNT